jgi:hypothetical protein
MFDVQVPFPFEISNVKYVKSEIPRRPFASIFDLPCPIGTPGTAWYG